MTDQTAADQPTTEPSAEDPHATYTPTTEDVRDVWVESQTGGEYGPLDDGQTARAQFDRWFDALAPAPQPAADTEREVQARALREAVLEMDNTDDPDAIHVSNGDIDLWLEARADRIEREGTTP